MDNDAFRNSVAFGCVVGGIWLHYAATIDFLLGMLLWLFLAAGVGYTRPSGWMILVAPVPYIIGVGGGLLTGQHDSLGEVWFMSFLISTVAGAIGIIIGAAAKQGRGRPQTDD